MHENAILLNNGLDNCLVSLGTKPSSQPIVRKITDATKS